MWSLWGWNTWNGDYDPYCAIFEDSLKSIGGYESGYKMINAFFLSLGFSFQGYLILYSFVVLSLVLYLCLNYCKYPALFSAIYFLIFIQEYVFLRNYLVSTLFVLALLPIFRGDKKGLVIFVIVVFISSFIHSTAILFLVFLPVLKPKLVNIKLIFIFQIVVFLFFVFIFRYLLPFFGGSLNEKFDAYSVGGYITNSSFLHLFIVFLIYRTYKVVSSNLEKFPLITKRIVVIVVNINLLSLFYLGLYYNVPYFASRFLRCIFVLNLFFFLTILPYLLNKKDKRKVIFNLGGLIVVILFFLLFASTPPLSIIPLYRCNIIWGNEYYVPILD